MSLRSRLGLGPRSSSEGGGRDLSPVLERIDRLESAVKRALEAHPLETPVAHLQRAVAELEDQKEELLFAVDEGIKHVDRSERRVRAVVQSARRRMENAGYVDEGLEAEAADLRDYDADARRGEGLQPVQAHLELDRPHPPNLPGTWSSEHLRILRGA